jgi:septation ring formation regulator EzrA
LHRELHQLRTEKEQSWRKLRNLKRTEEKARDEAQQAQGKAEKLQAEVEQANTTLAGLKEEFSTATAKADKHRESMKVTAASPVAMVLLYLIKANGGRIERRNDLDGLNRI